MEESQFQQSASEHFETLVVADEATRGRCRVDNTRFRELLALASRHLVEARCVIEQQEKLISELLNQGADTSEAQALLEKLRASAEAMAEHERSIERQIRAFEGNTDRLD